MRINLPPGGGEHGESYMRQCHHLQIGTLAFPIAGDAYSEQHGSLTVDKDQDNTSYMPKPKTESSLEI